MHRQNSNRGYPAGNPIANALVVIAGIVVIGFSLVVGFVAFIGLASVLLVLAAIVGIRVWWLKRKLHKSFARDHGTDGARERSAGRIEIIEGEYRDVSRDEDGQRR